ncbi:complement regulator-acquiring protein (plasmid) [Borreliella yangtzensis]|uniref:complement regulator-acquiring protein n=1 Tax=Borreliella yangtzensis TaxID=683292 RepID=UPI003B683417
MKTNKFNITRFNIIIIMLTLICISCSPIAKTDINPKSHTNHIETNQSLKNEYQNPEPSDQNNRDIESSNQDSIETINSKLETIKEALEEQKKQEDIEIAKIANTEFDFLDTFKTSPNEIISTEQQMILKRIIYSSLNYDTQKIGTLKEILEKLNKTNEYNNTLVRFTYFISWSIQVRIENYLESINNTFINQKDAENALIALESTLKLKKRFVKTLNETLEAYNQNYNNIKTDTEKLANHIDENYNSMDSLKPID